MFLAGLSHEKQEAFLDLAYTWFTGTADLSKAHGIDFAEGLAAFDDSSVEEKTGIFFELYAIALIDESYPEEEKILVDIMQKRFGIRDEKMQEMRNGLNVLTAACTRCR